MLPFFRFPSLGAQTLLYALLGAAGLTLAIPPGYASPVFPAAGLALALALHHGWRALPAVFLGSLLLNLGLALQSGTLGVRAGVAAAGIALGASLQAWLGQSLVHWRMGRGWQQLENEGQTVALVVQGGLLACLVSPTVAVCTLWGLDFVTHGSAMVHWWTWYLGDFLGVAVFAPLSLLLLSPRDELTHLRRRKVVVPTCAMLAVSMLFYALANLSERRQVQTQVERAGNALVKLIHDRLITHQTLVSSLAHFVESNPDYNARQFGQFTRSALADVPDLFALSFNDEVPREQLTAYEAGVRQRKGQDDFRVRERDASEQLVPVGERERYVVVRDIEPFDANAPAVGFDIWSDPVRRQAIERSRASGKAAVTAPLRLVQEPQQRQGVLLLEPVYRATSRNGQKGTAQAQPMGYAVAVIKVDAFIDIAVLDQLPMGLKFLVHDRQSPPNAPSFVGTAPRADLPSYRRWSGHIPIANRQWTMEVWAEDAFLQQSPRWLSWGVGVLSLMFTVLLQIHLYGMTGREHTMRCQNQQLRDKQNQLHLAETVFQNTAEAIVVTDPMGAILAVNPAFEHITGYTLAEVKGQKMSVLSSGEHPPDFYRAMWRQLLTEHKWRGEMVNRRKNGEHYAQHLTISTVCDAHGLVVQYVGTFSDISEREAALKKAEFLAYHDNLTGLPNRNWGEQCAEQAMAGARRHGEQVAVLFMDLDHFKLVNDSYGHNVGDLLLQAVADRLRRHVRAEDTLCRISGDEFMLILQHLRDTHDVVATCEHLLRELSAPYQIDGRLLQTSLSIGIAMAMAEGERQSGADLLRNADTAMFEAKQAGRNTYRFFDQAMNHSVVAFVETRDALVQALERGEFELYYQPQVRLSDHRVVGAEALLRWHHPHEGLLAPGRFLSVAEHSGLIVPIGAWVVQQACRQMRAWVDEGLPLDILAVNLSAIQFRNDDLEKTIVDALAAVQLSPSRLELELTESILISDQDKARAILRRLKDLGIHLSIDDFGTGYSGMAYLKRFRVDTLKIDASFAKGVGKDADDTAIVRAILQVAQTLGLETTAEGVELPETVAMLREMGCTHVQGYVYAQPLSAQAFAAWLVAHQGQLS